MTTRARPWPIRLVRALTRQAAAAQISYRVWLARVLALVAAALMIVSAIVFRAAPLEDLPESWLRDDGHLVASDMRDLPFAERRSDDALIVMLGGGLLLTLALALVSLPPADFPFASEGLRPRRANWALIALGALVLLILADANGQHFDRLQRFHHMSSDQQMALFVLGPALIIWGFAGGGLRIQKWPGWLRAARAMPQMRRRVTPRPSAGVHDTQPRIALQITHTRPRITRALNRLLSSEALWITLIGGLALWLRLWNLEDSIHAFVDELNFADTTRWFWSIPDLDILMPITGVVAFPRLYTWPMAQAVIVFDNTLLALRIVSAVFGAATVLALYFQARVLFDRPTAVIAALLLAVMPPHLHYSRLALNNIADPLVGTLALAFFANGLRTGRRLDFALAGICLGLTQYFYEAGKFVYIAVMWGWLISGYILWKQRPPARGMDIMLITALLMAAPLYYALWARQTPFFGRTEQMSFGSDYWQRLLVADPDESLLLHHLEHIRETFMVYTSRHEGSFYYGGLTPLVLIYVAPLVLLGLFHALWRLRTPGGALPLLLIFATSMGNSFLPLHTHSTRFVAALPALALLAALGLRHTLPIWWPDGVRPRLRWLLIAALLVPMAAGQAWYYFGPHLDRYNETHRMVKGYPDGEDALFRAVDLPEETPIYLISDPIYPEQYAIDIMKYLADNRQIIVMTPDLLTAPTLAALPHDIDHAFFVATEVEANVLPVLESYFYMEDPQYTDYPIPEERQFVLYYAPAALNTDPPGPARPDVDSHIMPGATGLPPASEVTP